MEIDPSCYTFKRMEVEKGLFDPSVDATYVITLEGNGRYERVVEQLKKYHPTRIVYIMTNKGFKKCKKNLLMDLPRCDLTDAFMNTFKHAKKEGYKNILVLEDDFIFSDDVLDPKTDDIVNKFVAARTDTKFFYVLGALPMFQIPYDQYHNIIYGFGGTHAIIYSELFRDRAMRDYTDRKIDDWDVYTNDGFSQYAYYKPLAYQTFPMTENRKQWAIPGFVAVISDYYIDAFKLDLQPEVGFNFFYIFSKVLFYLLIAAFIALVGGALYGVSRLLKGRRRR